MKRKRQQEEQVVDGIPNTKLHLKRIKYEAKARASLAQRGLMLGCCRHGNEHLVP